MSDAELVADLLVVGAGMAGLSAASYAARHGATVIVVEKASEIGGSGVLSGGGLWTATSIDDYRLLDPQSDAALVRLLIDGFPEAAGWVEALGADIAPPRSIDAIQGYPSVVRVFDNFGYLQRCRAAVLEAGGWVVTDAEVRSLVVEGGRVSGAVVADRDGDAVVRAPWTILATGGFQGSDELCRELIGEHAVGLPLRANAASDGAGLRLARSVGAALNAETENFYGHLVPHPLPPKFGPGDFLRLAQIYSARTILLDRDGHRFVDESKAYYRNASAVSHQPDRRALLIGDEVVRETDRTMYGGGTESIDRPLEAQLAGGHVVIADTLEELDAGVAAWGYAGVADGVRRYNEELVADDGRLDPPRAAFRAPYLEPPYFAMEVQPAITFTFGGLRADDHARVLDEAGAPIPGLLAAGVDIGVYHSVYAGGLAFGLVTGVAAAKVALGEKSRT